VEVSTFRTDPRSCCGRHQGCDAVIEIAYVAAPQSEHRWLALLAIGSGKHVLIEKPIALTATEAEERLPRSPGPRKCSWRRRCGPAPCRSST
jgi:hypothetical protein